MIKTNLKIFAVVLFCCFFMPAFVSARENISDWYLSDFESEIVVNKDSSLLITEKIIADCGDLPDKHGIFRVLPTEIKTEKAVFKNPIELVSVADFDGRPYKYQTIKDRKNNTISWKIGDPDVTVTGKNYYQIVYRVKNAIRFGNPDFDELYWNLSGNFWNIEIDNFSAKIVLPTEINKQDVQMEYYAGFLGEKSDDLAYYNWLDGRTMLFKSASALAAGQGITVSLSFPKGIFVPYQPGFFEKRGDDLSWLFFLIPVLVFFFVFRVWEKHGKDPALKKPIPPEFGIPENITPIQTAMVISSGVWKDNFIAAALIDLAVKGFIVIEEIESKVLLFKSKDFVIKKNIEDFSKAGLGETERLLLEKIFKYGNGQTVNLSEMKRKFYKDIPSIKEAAEEDIVGNKWFEKKGSSFSFRFILIGIVLLGSSVWLMSIFYPSAKLFLAVFASGLIFLIFGSLMPKRTRKGADLFFRINGFKLYMETAEKYRQRFFEKENIFDKFLPYAMVFGIAEFWAKKMRQIYGEEYYKNYHPVWFAAAGLHPFSADIFISRLNGISASISSNMTGSSGVGGGGGAGGGGGGGGGGGW